jgi:LysM repeat protein
MKVLIILIGVMLATITFASTKSNISRDQYVDAMSSLAIKQMTKYKIPASIKLAQAILESASGNSYLALKGNNHFGIKCHGWMGEEVYLDDDKKNECFRVYKTVEESYSDHSEFLTKNTRYAFLFEYESDDYKSWARGLKRAGYATNPKYTQLLIDIIEGMRLDKYDACSKPSISSNFKFFKDKKNSANEQEVEILESSSKVLVKQTNEHEIQTHTRGVNYIISEAGDTFFSISKEFGLKLSQLYRYNSFYKEKYILTEGDIIYIEPKLRRKVFKKEVITLTSTMSLVDISQSNAINLKSLIRLNHFSDTNEVITKGERITLR